MSLTQLAKDALVAVVAGYAGTKVLEQVAMKTYQWESEGDRKREDEARPGPPFVLAADTLSKRLLGVELDEKQLAKAGMAFHYLAGVSWVPVYMGLRRAGWRPTTAGLATGVSQSAILDEVITPAVGASAPNPDYPFVTHLRGVVAHTAYGLAVAGIVEAGWRLLEER